MQVGIVVGWIVSMLKTCLFMSRAHAKVPRRRTPRVAPVERVAGPSRHSGSRDPRPSRRHAPCREGLRSNVWAHATVLRKGRDGAESVRQLSATA